MPAMRPQGRRPRPQASSPQASPQQQRPPQQRPHAALGEPNLQAADPRVLRVMESTGSNDPVDAVAQRISGLREQYARQRQAGATPEQLGEIARSGQAARSVYENPAAMGLNPAIVGQAPSPDLLAAMSRANNADLGGGDATFPQMIYGNIGGSPGMQDTMRSRMMSGQSANEQINSDLRTRSVIARELEQTQAQLSSQGIAPETQAALQRKAAMLGDRVNQLDGRIEGEVNRSVPNMAFSQRYEGFDPASGFGKTQDSLMGGRTITQVGPSTASRQLGLSAQQMMNLPPADTELLMRVGDYGRQSGLPAARMPFNVFDPASDPGIPTQLARENRARVALKEKAPGLYALEDYQVGAQQQGANYSPGNAMTLDDVMGDVQLQQSRLQQGTETIYRPTAIGSEYGIFPDADMMAAEGKLGQMREAFKEERDPARRAAMMREGQALNQYLERRATTQMELGNREGAAGQADQMGLMDLNRQELDPAFGSGGEFFQDVKRVGTPGFVREGIGSTGIRPAVQMPSYGVMNPNEPSMKAQLMGDRLGAQSDPRFSIQQMAGNTNVAGSPSGGMGLMLQQSGDYRNTGAPSVGIVPQVGALNNPAVTNVYRQGVPTITESVRLGATDLSTPESLFFNRPMEAPAPGTNMSGAFYENGVLMRPAGNRGIQVDDGGRMLIETADPNLQAPYNLFQDASTQYGDALGRVKAATDFDSGLQYESGRDGIGVFSRIARPTSTTPMARTLDDPGLRSAEVDAAEALDMQLMAKRHLLQESDPDISPYQQAARRLKIGGDYPVNENASMTESIAGKLAAERVASGGRDPSGLQPVERLGGDDSEALGAIAAQARLNHVNAQRRSVGLAPITPETDNPLTIMDAIESTAREGAHADALYARAGGLRNLAAERQAGLTQRIQGQAEAEQRKVGGIEQQRNQMATRLGLDPSTESTLVRYLERRKLTGSPGYRTMQAGDEAEMRRRMTAGGISF